jgi:hypothetical protein
MIFAGASDLVTSFSSALDLFRSFLAIFHSQRQAKLQVLHVYIADLQQADLLLVANTHGHRQYQRGSSSTPRLSTRMTRV